MQTACEQLAGQIGELFVCSPLKKYTRIRTPYLYPDGDVIDIYLKEQNGESTLTDLGETLRWLRMQTAATQRSPKQRQLIEYACMTHGVELFKGMLMLRLARTENLAAAITRLSQAALRVADIWFTFRTRAIESPTDEVEELLREKVIPFERGERLAGRSGRIWTVDFHTRHPRRSALVNVLSTGSRAAARGVSEHVLALWYDLSHLNVGPEALRFVSLFDDTMDVWTAEDFRLVETLSEIARWSRPDEFVEKIAA
jgi:hypothetical protein